MYEVAYKMERPQIRKEVDKHFYDISLTVDS